MDEIFLQTLEKSFLKYLNSSERSNKIVYFTLANCKY